MVENERLDITPNISKHNLNFKVKNPKKWNAEHPNLYQLVLVLKGENNKILDVKYQD